MSVHDSDIDRFNAKFIRLRPDDCWEWTAFKSQGYGRFNYGGDVRAHVFAWMLANGRWPRKGLLVRHTCNNRGCVNPAHLREGTYSENNTDTVVAGAHVNHQVFKTHCPQGHPYSGDNLAVTKRGRRVCRECHREANRKYAAGPAFTTLIDMSRL